MQRKNVQIYVVRVWKENPKDKNWRGSIQNVRTGQNESASNLNELADFIRRFFDLETNKRSKQQSGLK
jgi:hypothetical protein